jgi:DNA-binding SARP family transcriptional activator
MLSLNTRLYARSFRAHDALAEAYEKDGNLQLAVKHLEESLRLSPGSEKTRDKLIQLKSSRSE